MKKSILIAVLTASIATSAFAQWKPAGDSLFLTQLLLAGFIYFGYDGNIDSFVSVRKIHGYGARLTDLRKKK